MSGGTCSHPFRHIVYGADDPDEVGATCSTCGEKLTVMNRD